MSNTNMQITFHTTNDVFKTLYHTPVDDTIEFTYYFLFSLSIEMYTVSTQIIQKPCRGNIHHPYVHITNIFP